jgi:hypothetical protein
MEMRQCCRVVGSQHDQTHNPHLIGRNSPLSFRLALVTVTGDQASAPLYVSGSDWGVPGFGDTQITENLQQLLAAGSQPH